MDEMKSFESLKEGDRLYYFDSKKINLKVHEVTGTSVKGNTFYVRFKDEDKLACISLDITEKVLCFKAVGGGRTYITDTELLYSIFSNFKEDITKALDQFYEKTQDF